MAEAARQATGAAGSGACPKTGRRRLALWRAGVADRGEDELTVRRRSRLGGKGRRVGSGRCPPPRRLAARGRRGGGTAPPRCRAPAVACAGGRCPVRSTAPAADQRPALTSPRVRRWARGVAPATSRRHHRHRRSARGRRGRVGLRSASRPRRDAKGTCARCARFARLERVGDLGRDKRLTSRCSVQRAAVRRGGDLALALREPYVRGCRGSGDVKAWWWADKFSVSGRLPYLHLA